MDEEKFAIPGAGGIITRIINNEEYILLQERVKKGAENEYGLLEIPAGKIRAYENIYDCLRREIYEETGYEVDRIEGENESKIIEINGYKVLSYKPFANAQNIMGYYPIMVQVFICSVKNDDKIHKESNESKNIRWERVSKIREMIKNRDRFYPMQIAALEEYLFKHNKQVAVNE